MLSFASALHRGLGRAIQHLEQPIDGETHALVLDACLNNRAYDPQIEGPRPTYLLEAAHLAGLTPTLTLQLSEALQDADQDAEDYWSLQQRVELLLALGRDGDLEAEQALNGLYRSRLDRPGTLLTMLENAYFDFYGPTGLLQVMRDRAARHGDQADSWDEALLRRARDDLGLEVFGEVMKQARSEPDVRVYLEALEVLVEQVRAERRPMSTQPIDYVQARQAVDRNGPRSAFTLRSPQLTEEALIGLAADLEHEADPDVLWLLMVAFQRRTYPNAPAGTGSAP
ncbi:hypothetical protein Q0M94_06430 [Deinococcus radiomollis]|uniref:hypothetical protein n=1 Tax=Deinococcus radiomollis TaxID=468916 RepID=UPI0038917442